MAETSFAVEYDGPALAEGRMPVRDLAPALLALGEIFTGASRILYPDNPPVTLNIKATEEGSFLVQLLLEGGHVWDQFVDLFSSDEVDALTNLKALILGGGGTVTVGVLMLIRQLRNRDVQKQEPGPSQGHITLTLSDGTKLEIPNEVWLLYRNREIRQSARQVVAPLTQQGVDSVTFVEEPSHPSVVIRRDDVPAYEIPEEPEVELLDEESELVVEIASVVFTEGHKWQLNDGLQTFWASVDDQDFLRRVETGTEVFRKGDMLRCRMRTVQTRRGGALHAERVVLEVIEHIPGPMQLSLGDVALDDEPPPTGLTS